MQIIPVQPSIPWQEITLTINDPATTPVTYIFEFKFNTRDNTWYLNITDTNKLPIATSIRIVLGTYLGRLSRHPLFRSGVLVAIDTSRQGKEAGLDDLGKRVVLARFTTQEILVGRGFFG